MLRSLDDRIEVRDNGRSGGGLLLFTLCFVLEAVELDC